MHVVLRWLQEVFESHRVVFTVGTSVASIVTAWGGTLLLLPPLTLMVRLFVSFYCSQRRIG
jgi:hypothetical protein